MWFLIPLFAGAVVFNRMTKKFCQAAQYNNQNQSVGARVRSGYGYNKFINEAPLGPCTIAKAGTNLGCTISVQSKNPKTPTVCNPPNAGRQPVPTGIFLVDGKGFHCGGASVVEIATSGATWIQFYDSAKNMVAQVKAAPNDITSFTYSAEVTIERAVLIGPGGSTVVMNNPPNWIQAGVEAPVYSSLRGIAFQDKTTCMVQALDQSVPCSGFSAIGSSGCAVNRTN